MTYSTCTILQQENQDVITKFLADHPDFELQTTPTERDLKTDRTEKTLSIYPDDYLSDGFFIACLRKNNGGVVNNGFCIPVGYWPTT